MKSPSRSLRGRAHDVAFVIACVVVPFGGVYVEIGVLSAIDELGGFEEPYILAIRLLMIGVPTTLVASAIWLLSNRWYRRRTARISTVVVSTFGLLVYALVALTFTSGIG